ncbi:adrenocorticotropic hormone receptor-like [Montipora foliosa]|uniref:adrenocorticotropic hormone receptor-like n=1 Tax=Montipora foliosa TaxID=591990 RepID=UPI0035F12A4B
MMSNASQSLFSMAASAKACEDFPLRVNAVPYSPDSKTFTVTLFTCVFTGLVCPGAVAANVLVFMGILRKSELRNVYNTSILFLTGSDILKAFIPMPTFIVYQGTKLTKPQKDFSCTALVFYTFTTYLFTGLSVLTITLITLERYLAIFHPYRYCNHVTKRRIAVTISISWILWIAFITQARLSPIASTGMYSAIAASMLIPCILLTFIVYCKVYVLTKRVRLSIGHELSTPRNAEDIQETKSSRTVAYLAGVVVLCFVPTLALVVVHQTQAVSQNYLYHLLYPLTDTAVLLTPIFDPIIYVLRSNNVRSSLCELLWQRNTSRLSSRVRVFTGTATTSL